MTDTSVPLVFLAGSLCDGTMWRAQVEALADVAASVTIELSGFDRVEDMAAHVLQHAPSERFAIAGFSLGGFVALEVARQAPEQITHLALLDTSARPDVPENAPRRAANIDAFAADPAPIVEAFARSTAGPNTSSDVLAVVQAMMHRHGGKDYAAQQRAIMSRPDARPHLGAIACPTLVLCGGDDGVTPPELSRELSAAIPGAEYVELSGVGHMTPIEAPGGVSQALRQWLAAPAARDRATLERVK